MSDSPVRIEELEGGAVWRVLLARPKANVIDSAMSAVLTEVFERARVSVSASGLMISMLYT